MSHCKGPTPTEPGFYWARLFARWEPVEVREDMHVYAIGQEYAVLSDITDIYGNIEYWGARIVNGS